MMIASKFCTSCKKMFWSVSGKKSISLEETKPTNLPLLRPSSVIGTPEKPYFILTWVQNKL